MNRSILLAGLLFLGIEVAQAQSSENVHQSHQVVSPETLSDKGVYTMRVRLNGNEIPQVKISNTQTQIIDKLPANSQKSNSFEPDVFIAIERKKAVATIKIPAYKIAGSTIEKLLSFDITVTEPTTTGNNTAQRPTGTDESVLANGVWYKFAVKNKGIYKIDYNFLQNLTGNAAAINPQNIRIYGNGGTVLPEVVSEDQPDDLIENAISVSASGSSFGANDYILFYANGPIAFNKDSINQRFTHTSNFYEDVSYYFINFDQGPGKRINTINATGTSAYISNSFNDYWLHEIDSMNILKVGKLWLGNRMNTMNPATLNQTIPVNLGNITDTVYLTTRVASSNLASGNMAVKVGNNNNNISLSSVANVSKTYVLEERNYTYTGLPTSFNLTYTYSSGGSGSAFVDYALFNYRRPLQFGGGQLAFRDWRAAALPSGQNAMFQVMGTNSTTVVWEVTDPLTPIAVNGTRTDASLNIVRSGDRLREFIAFDGSQFHQPIFISNTPVPNQNLHGLAQMDYLMITAPEFKEEAEDLANFHRTKYGTKVAIAITNEVYNEFSSGSQDIGGIRNFIKLFYERATSESDMPKNVLLFGGASYDYKNRLTYNTNFVPIYATLNSNNADAGYSTDDFFILLDNGEDVNSSSTQLFDMGIGRMPVVSKAEAQTVVNKIKNYISPASYGPWKNNVTYVADDWETHMNHLEDSENTNRFFNDTGRHFNLYKIYTDAYTKIPSPSGNRYPAVNKAINDQIFNGTLLMSYTGHGSPERWADEAILTASDYGNWNNLNKLPVMVTATCDFSRLDNPSERSAGVKLLVSNKGGAIALVTTTQIVYAGANTRLNSAYVREQFQKQPDGTFKSFGQALKDAKNAMNSEQVNNYKYVVLGDPALSLALPQFNIATDSLQAIDNGMLVKADTINALGFYELSGSIKDANNQTVSNFNGQVYITIFDKPRRINSTNNQKIPNFISQTNVVAKVNGTVTNGTFSIQFVAPKDINFDFGNGKISYYAQSSDRDAAGLDTNIIVGGFNPNAGEDNDAPIVKPYIDNEKFRDGGVTGPNPLLHVKLFDENGINVSGTSIGHDLVAILDEDVQNPFVMNDYYQTLPNDYKNGYVNFPMYNLPEGKHTIRVRAWDVYNNSGEGTITFEVKNKDKGFISDLYNYPNPVTDITHIVFQHNQEGEDMDVTLQIFNPGGALVKSITQQITTTGNRTELIWDGTGNNGAPLARGLYFYKLHAKTSKGISATAYQKLVLLR